MCVSHFQRHSTGISSGERCWIPLRIRKKPVQSVHLRRLRLTDDIKPKLSFLHLQKVFIDFVSFVFVQQSRLSLSRAAAVSMEQRRIQDIANLFNPLPGMGVGMNVSDMATYPHYPSHYSYQVIMRKKFHSHSLYSNELYAQGAGMLPQHDQYGGHHMPLHMSDLGSQSSHPAGSVGPSTSLSLPQQPHYAPPNLGSAVSSSMHLTNSSHDSDVGTASGYKMDSDMMYYSVSRANCFCLRL